MMRGLFVAAIFFPTVLALLATQWVLQKLGIPGWGRLATGYYRFLCKLLRVRVHVEGDLLRDRPVLLVGNHTSWADILTIGSVAPVAFVAKKEVRAWPIVGPVAELQKTVFVDRERRQKTGTAIASMVERLAHHVPVVLFAEGTSNDGNRVLPFRSALIGAVRDAAGATAEQLAVQPMSVCYTNARGIPLGRIGRPLVAWYGDLDLMPHLKRFIDAGPFDCVISFGEPIAADAALDRKAVTRLLEQSVRGLTTVALRGAPNGNAVALASQSPAS